MNKQKQTAFDLIQDGLQEAIQHERGERRLSVRDVELPDPPAEMSAEEIADLRKNKLHVSQAVMARIVNASSQTIYAWEKGRKKPSGPALRLLSILENDPSIASSSRWPKGKRKGEKSKAG